MAAAQQETSAPTPTASITESGARAPVAAQAGDYRIGPGDVLDVRVFNLPQLSREATRVDGRGMIRLPFIEGEVQAGCRTEGELAKEIATRYLKYQRNPQVDVFIKEYGSQPVAVIGAVNAPGRFQLQRRVRLLDLLTYAGGPSARAGRNVQVVPASEAPRCEAAASGEQDAVVSEESTGYESYALSDMMRGEEKANPYVRSGDIISVPEAEQAYVVGNVLNPTPVSLRDPVTLTRAIAMAGGTMPDTKAEKVRIIRQTPGSTNSTEILVDLKAINRREASDVVLQPGDIVEVPTAGGKRALRNIFSAIIPAVGQLPIRVIR